MADTTRDKYTAPPPRSLLSQVKQEEVDLVASAVWEKIEPRLTAMEKKLEEVATTQGLQDMFAQLQQMWATGQPKTSPPRSANNGMYLSDCIRVLL